MPSIDIRRNHALNAKQARKAVDRVAARIAEEFAIECAWEGDTLEFARSGVSGHITLEDKEVRIRADLGFLLLPLRGRIKEEIERYLDKEFA